jgi:predicted transcriptional regulator
VVAKIVMIEERKALHAALDEAEADLEAGRVVSEEEVWATLRAIT